MDLIKVGSSTYPKDAAGSIMRAFEKSDDVVIRAVGAGSVNQAVKAIAIARGMMAPSGRDLWTRVGFADVESRDRQGDTVTAIVFRLDLR